MATTIDHLRQDHRITLLRDVTDARGVQLRAGEQGILRRQHWDQIRMDIELEIELPNRRVTLVFPVAAKTGPRNGHMREYFEMGEDVTPPRILPAFHDPSLRKMIVPPPEDRPTPATRRGPMNTADWSRAAQSTEGPDRLEAVEREMLAAMDHIGVAGSIAEMYAQRMRAFQRAGNEPRAVAAFKLAVQWMDSYAGSATSGGEGAALSYESDQFRKSLVLEFGYDPTDDGSPARSQCLLP